jgi:hypothetical protein
MLRGFQSTFAKEDASVLMYVTIPVSNASG